MKIHNVFLFLLMSVFYQTTFAQGFIPEIPDTNKINLLAEKSNHLESKGYIYLTSFYNINSPIDSVITYEWDSTEVCRFNQEFEYGIEYSLYACSEEGGDSERIAFPKIDEDILQLFIETLFYDPENTWVTEHNYAPNGAGCHYSITESKDKTILNIYCGC